MSGSCKAGAFGAARIAYPEFSTPEPAAMTQIVDLRSDTVTRPTAAMRRAMAEAEVGDDVFGDDPTVIALERRVAALGALARERGLAVHLDGARLWNAQVATGIPIADYAACADTVMMCFSKGLGAPVGSILTGGAGHIRAARRTRKRLGGGMRQVGI